ncbi:IS5/IS1182 family transposase [Erwinia tracheiphila]|uniref:IS5/IS1182 family transposase n=1 Tax=Erwinia tracheiphila TaxID=65700 RepID=A0A345CPR6_9GAMM|nr:IS5/IS1182 family transposase [Erwinia tracheiphila]AXF75433.1 IS5/IS1182 family transposase [Erwinia tracheiphila]EOS93734.1 transposase [Erwinia tracheiphila PSU-1]UIA82021.1 IS5/IS1182 family transposase [Erwinia tracheiphila]UIA89735.1 IS5/IS1182 family transposase [Erwinia tracheiphila]UIA90617.1 IS5/IS1182 family transposase [Erwinia tracheiphila]
MPHKHNTKKRHHIPKAKYTITNWSQYEAGLKQRGSLALWFIPEAITHRKAAVRTSPGEQPRYSDLAIQTCLMLRTAFSIPLRQTECMMPSVFSIMAVSLSVPDHTTVSRRVVRLPPLPRISAEGAAHILIDHYWAKGLWRGQWLEDKHGAKSR